VVRVGGWVGLGGLVKYWGGLPAWRQSPIPLLALAAGNWTRDHRVASPLDYRATRVRFSCEDSPWNFPNTFLTFDQFSDVSRYATQMVTHSARRSCWLTCPGWEPGTRHRCGWSPASMPGPRASNCWPAAAAGCATRRLRSRTSGTDETGSSPCDTRALLSLQYTAELLQQYQNETRNTQTALTLNLAVYFVRLFLYVVKVVTCQKQCKTDTQLAAWCSG